jgi:hypothetical protein
VIEEDAEKTNGGNGKAAATSNCCPPQRQRKSSAGLCIGKRLSAERGAVVRKMCVAEERETCIAKKGIRATCVANNALQFELELILISGMV